MSSAVVDPPATAAFQILNTSVTLQNISIVPTSSISTGVYVSSAFVVISSVNIQDPNSYIKSAGMALASYDTVSNLSMTAVSANFAYGFYLNGSSMTSISNCMVQGSFAGGAYLAAGSNFNTISQSTMAANENGLYLVGATSNTIIGGYYEGRSGGSFAAAFFDAGSNANTISLNTAVNTSNGDAIRLVSAASNTITGIVYTNSASGGIGLNLNTGCNGNVISWSNIGSGLSVNGNANAIIHSTATGGGQGAIILYGSSNNISQSSMTGTSAGLYLQGGSSNSISSSYMTGSYGVNFPGEFPPYVANTISQSTMGGDGFCRACLSGFDQPHPQRAICTGPTDTAR